MVKSPTLLNQMPDKPTSPSPFQITKRDLETVRYQNEPMRQASWTYPSTMLKGEDWPMVRQFALDTVMQMKQLYPEQFVGKTMQDWEQALVNFITTRRPDFRAQVLTQLKGRYGGGQAMDPDLILTKTMEGFGKKAESIQFPEDEKEALLARLKAGKNIFTSRMSAEKGKYNEGEHLKSLLGDLIVKRVKPIEKVERHPFLSELTESQKKQLSGNPFDLVELGKKAESALTLQHLVVESKKDPWYGLGTAEKSKEIFPLQHEGRLVGYLRTGKTMKGDKTTGFIYVTPAERRKGVGSKALAELARVHPEVLSFVNEKNVASLGAHAKAGFTPTGKHGKGSPENVILKRVGEAVEKKAAAPPPKIMQSVMRKLVPNWEGFLASKRSAQVREYRSEIGNLDSYPATLAQRLKSFKFWKRTGTVPAVSGNLRTQKVTDVHSDVKPGGPGYDVHRPMLWSGSAEPVKIVHYGKGESVSDVARNPSRRLDRSYIVPGQTRADVKGAYFGSPGVEFPGYGDKRLEVTVPLKAILRAPPGERQEAILPRGLSRNVIEHRLENKSHALFMDEIAKISGGPIGKMQEMSSVAGMKENPKPLAVQRKLGFKPL